MKIMTLQIAEIGKRPSHKGSSVLKQPVPFDETYFSFSSRQQVSATVPWSNTLPTPAGAGRQ
jgi:hypothetical protein